MILITNAVLFGLPFKLYLVTVLFNMVCAFRNTNWSLFVTGNGLSKIFTCCLIKYAIPSGAVFAVPAV